MTKPSRPVGRPRKSVSPNSSQSQSNDYASYSSPKQPDSPISKRTRSKSTNSDYAKTPKRARTFKSQANIAKKPKPNKAQKKSKKLRESMSQTEAYESMDRPPQVYDIQQIRLTDYLTPRSRLSEQSSNTNTLNVLNTNGPYFERIPLSRYLDPEQLFFYNSRMNEEESYRPHSTPLGDFRVPLIGVNNPSINNLNQDRISLDRMEPRMHENYYMDNIYGLDFTSDLSDISNSDSSSSDSSEYFYDVPEVLERMRQIDRRSELNTEKEPSTLKVRFDLSKHLSTPPEKPKQLIQDDTQESVNYERLEDFRAMDNSPSAFQVNSYNVSDDSSIRMRTKAQPKRFNLSDRFKKKKQLKFLEKAQLDYLERIEKQQENARHRQRMLHLKLKYIKLNLLLKNVKNKKQ